MREIGWGEMEREGNLEEGTLCVFEPLLRHLSLHSLVECDVTDFHEI